MTNKSKIVPGNNNQCVQRSVSILRTALGYPAGLPQDWHPTAECPTGLWLADIFNLLRRAFPDREVCIYCEDESPFVNHPGVHGSSSLEGDKVNSNDLIWMFAYTTESTKESHCVIGTPVTYGGELQIAWAASISLDINVVQKEDNTVGEQ